MIEFILGLVMGYALSGDLGEPVPSEIITYSDSGNVVKVYRSNAFAHRYYPNALAIGWNTNDYRYWETRPHITPVYTKSIIINKNQRKNLNQGLKMTNKDCCCCCCGCKND